MSDTNDSFKTSRGHRARDAQDASPAEGENTTLRFVSFNILHGRRPNGPVDLAALARSISDLRADVLALQEVDRRMVRSRFADLTVIAAAASGLHGVFRSARRRYDLGLYGNALLGRGRLYDVEVRHLPRKGWRRERRIAILASLDIEGRTWRVGAVHLSLFREESEPQLRMLLQELAVHDGPAVLMGDFNRRSHEVIPLARSLGWGAVDAANTYPAWEPTIRLDYVLTHNCEAQSAEVIETEVSDHRALVVEVRG